MTRRPTPAPHTPATLYLSAPEAARLIAAKGLPACLEGIADCIAADFRRWGDFDKVPRVPSYSPGGAIELMPIADDATYTFKYVNGHPGNTRLGLPTVMAFGVLADVATGTPRFLSELTLTTALRTAAMSAVAARALAMPGSRVMALIGNGAQSEFQALAFQHLVGIRELRLFDTDPQATAKLQANLAGSGLALTRCSSTAEAARGADIITTITADKARAKVLCADMVGPGTHINAVGGDCPGKTELEAAVLPLARVFVEYTPQTRVEGEIQQMPADFPVTELWEVLAGRAAGRHSADEITVFDSVGFALEDFSALRFMHAAAVALGMGTPIDLIPVLDDPRDLFALLRPKAAQWPAAARRMHTSRAAQAEPA